MERISRRVIVPQELAGKRLDQAAAILLDEFSRSRLKLWIDGGELTVGGACAEAKSRVRGGEELILDAELVALVPIEAEPIPLEIVHEDKQLFVINKGAGLVVHPGAGNASGTMQNALLNIDPALSSVPREGIVHRLDKDTSGLLLIARTLSAQQSLVAQIERREVRRVYEGVCQTALTGGGTVAAPIDRHPRDRTKMAVRDGGRKARTHYRVLERFRAHTHLEIELDTGRTHQIRVHMAHIRAPLVGDRTYGGRARLPREASPATREFLQTFPRQALHAVRLSLAHPLDGQRLSFESPLAADVADLLAVLRADRVSSQT